MTAVSVRGSLSAALILFLLPITVKAQQNPRLIEAVGIAQDGHTDSARVLVARLLEAAAPTDTLYPEILYTQGLVARTVDEMRRSYQRIAVEYATSPWADDALLRLAMLDYAAGAPEGTARQVERLRIDYPQSPLLPLAAYWGARAYFDLRQPADACRWVASGLGQAGDDVELKSQLGFYQGRCAVLASRPPDSTRTDSATRVPAEPAQPKPVPAKPGFAVQYAAVRTRVAAEKIVGELKEAGFEARVVREAGYFKVRVGSFPDRARAQAAASAIKAKTGGMPFVVQES